MSFSAIVLRLVSSYSELYCSLKSPEAPKLKQQHYSPGTSILMNLKKKCIVILGKKLEIGENNKLNLS